ncbi:UNKNOWN [Stylonychia lemnae]|uniref:Uncharacterized protein n=1 Tax=Stylonychia lemnae TaxID=5949 RepID=A0A078ABH6_STYLE|nr:UNKNOWN [Stylonychia lemnae]|eukprot:CDW78138.1 UNKNOWN [Stylonychia lemnae]
MSQSRGSKQRPIKNQIISQESSYGQQNQSKADKTTPRSVTSRKVINQNPLSSSKSVKHLKRKAISPSSHSESSFDNMSQSRKSIQRDKKSIGSLSFRSKMNADSIIQKHYQSMEDFNVKKQIMIDGPGKILQRQLDLLKHQYNRRKARLESLYQELMVIEQANLARERFKYLEEKEAQRIISLKDIQELTEEELEKKHTNLADEFNKLHIQIDIQESDKDQLIAMRSRLKQQIFFDKQKQIKIEDKVIHSEKMSADIPRLELMNKYRILATDQSILFVRSELEAKSQNRSQILYKNHLALDNESNQVKKMQEDFYNVVTKKEYMQRKLEKLKKKNREEELSFNQFIQNYEQREKERVQIVRLYCLLYLRETVIGIRTHSNVQASMSNLVSIDVEAFKEMKEMYISKQQLDKKIDKRLELLNSIKNDKLMTKSRSITKRATLMIDQNSSFQKFSQIQPGQNHQASPYQSIFRLSSLRKRNSSNDSSSKLNSSELSHQKDGLNVLQTQLSGQQIFEMLFKQSDELTYYQELFWIIERHGFLKFDDKELVHLIDKRNVYLESISKLYNDLALVNKMKVKEYENLVAELEQAELNRQEIEVSNPHKIKKQSTLNQHQPRKLTYFELKNKLELVRIEIDQQKDRISYNMKFINQMEANTIELMRKVTFKVKVIDQMSISLQEGQSPQIERQPSDIIIGSNNDKLSIISPNTLVNLLQNKNIIIPDGLQVQDSIIVNNKELVEMVNIFEDNYWIQPEKVEQRYYQKKSPQKILKRDLSKSRSQKFRFKSKTLKKRQKANNDDNSSYGYGSIEQSTIGENISRIASQERISNSSLKQTPGKVKLDTEIRVEESPNHQQEQQNYLLNSETQKKFLRGVVRKYKFFFLFAYIMKFLKIIKQSSIKSNVPIINPIYSKVTAQRI